MDGKGQMKVTSKKDMWEKCNLKKCNRQDGKNKSDS